MSWTPDIVLLKVELANLDAFASKVDFNERRKMGKTSDKTVYKTTGWCGFGSGSNTAAVDTKDGRIARGNVQFFAHFDSSIA